MSEATEDSGRTAPVRRDPGVLVGLLVAASVAILPMCDASREAEVANMLAGTGLSSKGGTSAVGAYVLYLAIAAVITFAIARAFRLRGRASIGVVVIASLISVAVMYQSTAKIARKRSRAVDSWSLCEQPSLSAQGRSIPVSPYRTRTSIEGPHLGNDAPCVSESEHRDAHAREHPDGDVVDGIRQVMYRFPRYRWRVIYTPALLLLGLVAGIAITVWYERRRSA